MEGTAADRAQMWHQFLFFGAFTKFRKATISFVLPAVPSVLMEQLDSHWTDFIKLYIRVYFENVAHFHC
jgi:hypothetical protein